MSSNLEGDLNGDGIVDEMDRVRNDLGGDIDQLGEKMRNMFDWQAYVRSAPLTSVAAAAVLGYLLAPRLRSRPVVDVVSGTARPGGISSLVTNVIWGGIAQAGSSYLAELLTGGLNKSSASETTEPETPSDPFRPSAFGD